ncbi:hypothetical protein V9T40_000393 [Parthenolecanium corni]|uniref:Uncharacterized protein n=1 Tax=Parthenolecanium corni TaxID=536013 RepID=A0AAN9Y0F9_9HEMI
MELAAVAINKHSVFTQRQRILRQEDQIKHKTAKAIIILWQRLPTMMKTDKILVNVTQWLFATAIAEADNATKILFEQLELNIKEDPKLYGEFIDIKSKLGDDESTNSSHDSYIVKKVDEDESKVREKFIRLPQITRLIYNKHFILASNGTLSTNDTLGKELCALIWAILKVSEKPEFTSKLQNLYDEVLDEISKTTIEENLENRSAKLFKNLEKRLDGDMNLKSQINATQKEVIASGTCRNKREEATTVEKESIFQRFRDKVKSFFQPVRDWFAQLVKEMVRSFKTFGGLTLRIELAAIAVNEHLAFPQQTLRQEDQIEHKTAKAIIILWQRLPTMMKTDNILVNVTDSLIATAITEADNATKILFEQLELKFKEDPKLYAEFVDVKSKLADEITNSSHGHIGKKVDEDESKAIEEFLRLPQITRLIYNKRFILTSKRSNLITKDELEKEFCSMIWAVLKVAEKPEFTSQLQNLYDEVLDEISKNYDPVEKLADGSMELFKNLEKRLDGDMNLKSQINATQKEVIASGVCNTENASSLDSLLIL